MLTRSVLVAAVTVLGLASLPAFAHSDVTVKAPAISAAPHLAVIKPAPDFTLVDTNGQPVRLAQLRGRIVLLAFVFSVCTTPFLVIADHLSVLQGPLT